MEILPKLWTCTVPFYSLKVEGAFSSFEIFISDTRLKELMKVRHLLQVFLLCGTGIHYILRDAMKLFYCRSMYRCYSPFKFLHHH